VDKTLVDIMKNFTANRTFSRGIEQLTAEASMVFMGNTQKSVAYMLKHSHFFEPLPDKYINAAFLDRIHAYNPGGEVAPIRHEMFTNGYGFVVDYIAEVLKHLRTEDFTGAYKKYFEITSEVSTTIIASLLTSVTHHGPHREGSARRHYKEPGRGTRYEPLSPSRVWNRACCSPLSDTSLGGQRRFRRSSGPRRVGYADP
jgi:hypothetical protein